MAEALRINCEGRWLYAPAGGMIQSRLERLAKAGMASYSNGTIMLRSDAGPLLWNLLNRNEPPKQNTPPEVENILSDLVRIQSVNPPGGEIGVAQYLKKWMNLN